MQKKDKSTRVSLYNRCLNGIERVGNGLPHPVILFAMFALAVVVISAVCAALGVSATGMLVSGGELKVAASYAGLLLADETGEIVITGGTIEGSVYGAGIGDIVLANNDGGAAQMIAHDKTLIASVTICGVIDHFTVDGEIREDH